MGGRAAGMAYATSPLSDEWSLFNNAAGIAAAKKTTLGAAYSMNPVLHGANRVAFAASHPFSIGAFSIGAFAFGDDLYNEQKVSLAYANTLGLASLGLTINYLQYSAEGFGTRGVTTVSLGGIANLTPTISVGAHIQNINQPYLTETEDERVPTILTAGIGFKPSDKAMLVAEVEKNLQYKALYKTGIEYAFTSRFLARTGFTINPTSLFVGIGFHQSKIHIDYAVQYTPTAIGYSHHASVTYLMKEK
jgi:hypothetical protein